MNIRDRLPALFVIGFLLIGGIFVANRYLSSSETSSPVEVKVPQLSQSARRGGKSFEANCASCHGVNAAGTDKGPPLVHDIYNPGHHGDGAFLRAVRRGVRQHHWPFGNMPPQSHVSDPDIQAITKYIRELQAANGISYRRHRM